MPFNALRRHRPWRSIPPSSGPFTTASPWRPTSPSVRVSSFIVTSRVHLATSAPFRVRAAAPIRPVRHGDGGRSVFCHGSCRLSATGIRFLAILFPPGDWASLAVGLPASPTTPDPDGVSMLRTLEMRPEWVPSVPRGRRCPMRPVVCDRSPSATFQQLRPFTPEQLPSLGLALTRRHQGFIFFTRPAFPSPVVSRMGQRPPWAFLRASHPAVTGDACRSGDRSWALT
jgi:hypothetical protein